MSREAKTPLPFVLAVAFALVLAVAIALIFAVAFASLVVIPEGDLLFSLLHYFSTGCHLNHFKCQGALSIASLAKGAKPEGEAIDFIAIAVAVVFLLPYSAQKSHVKSKKHLTHCHTTTSAWHFSYPQPAILDI
jgi:large-conductance mechanosensitive channel